MRIAFSPAELRRVTLFQGLDDRDLARIAADLTPSTYPVGRDLITVGQPGDRVYVVLSGTVNVSIDDVDGNMVILALLGPGEVVGEMSLVDNLTRSASVTTLESSRIASMERAIFWRHLNNTPKMMSNMITLLSRRLRLADLRIQAAATLDVEGRVALQLLALAQALGEPDARGAIEIPIRVSQNDLAALVGASRVRVNQIVVEYKRRGYISIDRRLRITILQPAALQEQLDQELLDPSSILARPTTSL